MRKIKVGIVNYLNTAPLLYGLATSDLKDDIELIPDFPSNLARALKAGEIDLGLVPVAVIPELETSCIVGNYCIGSDGPVTSVAIFSEVPIEQIDTVLLDYQSRTSVVLARILLREYWKKEVRFISAGESFRSSIRGRTAAVVIGDRALEQRSVSKFEYDLGAAWKLHTGLPFVFAAWVGNRSFDSSFIKAFDEANAYGLSHLDEVIRLHSPSPFDLRTYYIEHLSYELDAAKRRGLEKFLEFLKSGEYA